MKIEKLDLGEQLSSLIQSCSFIESNNFSAYVPQTLGLPEATPELIILLDGYIDVFYGDKSYHISKSSVFTFIDRPILIIPSSHICLIKITFHPLGVFPLLKLSGIPPNELISSPIISAIDLFKNDIHRLESQLHESANIYEMEKYISTFLIESLKERPIDHINHKIIQSIQSNVFNVDDLCHSLIVEPRTLQRWFSTNMGISPKYFLRLQRFKRTINELSLKQDIDFLELAIRNGYFDQNHLIKEMKHFTGQTPHKLSFEKYLPIQLKFD